MYRFAHPEYLYGLLIIPVLIAVFIIVRAVRKRSMLRFGEINVIRHLMPEVSNSRPVWKFIIFLIALAFFITGMAQPQAGAKLEEVKRKGVELVIALDVSNSMLAEDIKPNRLERAKRAISKLIDRLDRKSVV